MNYAEHKAMLSALESGTATPEQQRLAHAHMLNMRRQHNQDMRDAERDARDAYAEGRANAGQDARGEPYGTW